MDKRFVFSLFVALCASALHTSSAFDRIVVNADNIINKIYVDNKDMTGLLVNRRRLKKCDKIDIPVNSGVIAIQATNIRRYYGIHTCLTANNALYSDWHCRPIYRAKSPDWYRTDFNDKGWKPSKGHKCVKHCRQYYKQPCKLYSQKCHWSNKWALRVRCRAKLCADNCKSCKLTGTGKCDAGQCIQGSGVNALTSEESCNRRCKIAVKSHKESYDVPNGAYIRITDLTTMSTTEIPCPKAKWSYMAAIDISTCSVYELVEREVAGQPSLIQEKTKPGTESWVGSDHTEYANFVAIGLIVGNPDGLLNGLVARYTRLGDPTNLGVDKSNTYNNPPYYEGVFTGALHGPVTITDEIP